MNISPIPQRRFAVSPAKVSLITVLLWSILVLEVVGMVIKLDPRTGDTLKYYNLTEGLARGAFGVFDKGNYYPEAVRPPGYPLFLWFVTVVMHLPFAAVLWIQGALLLGGIALISRLVREYRYSDTPFLGLTALYPFTAAYACRYSPEAVSIFLVSLIVYLLARPRRPDAYATAAIGVLSGYSILVRPDLLLLPVLLALLLVWRLKVEYAGRESLGHAIFRWSVPGSRAALLLGMVVLTLLPYSVRNFNVFGSIAPSPPAGALGSSLYYASWQPLLPPHEVRDLWRGKVSSNMRRIGFIADIERINKSLGAPPHTPPFDPETYGPYPQPEIIASHTYLREALQHIQHQPTLYARHLARNSWLLWNTSEFPDSLPRAIKLLLQLLSGGIFLLGIGGIVWALWKGPLVWRITALVLLYFPLLHVWLHTEARYTASARPLLLLHAALFLMVLSKRMPPDSLAIQDTAIPATSRSEAV